MNLAAKLVRASEERGLTQARLAAECGVSRTTVGNWLAGRNTPSIAEAVSLSRCLRLPLSYLASDSNSPTPALADFARDQAWAEFGRRFKYADAFASETLDSEDIDQRNDAALRRLARLEIEYRKIEVAILTAILAGDVVPSPGDSPETTRETANIDETATERAASDIAEKIAQRRQRSLAG